MATGKTTKLRTVRGGRKPLECKRCESWIGYEGSPDQLIHAGVIGHDLVSAVQQSKDGCVRTNIEGRKTVIGRTRGRRIWVHITYTDEERERNANRALEVQMARRYLQVLKDDTAEKRREELLKRFDCLSEELTHDVFSAYRPDEFSLRKVRELIERAQAVIRNAVFTVDPDRLRDLLRIT